MFLNNSPKRKILITGVSGLLGSNLAWAYKDRHSVLGLYHRHPVTLEGIRVKKIDLGDGAGLKDCFHTFQPDLIIHCAALADVDLCEQEKAVAKQINVDGTRNVVEAMRHLPSRLIHISTDLVFDGTKGDYTEEDAVNPINHYGWTKYQAEREVLKRDQAVILRTTIFGWNVQDKESIGERIIHQLSRKEKIKGFHDAIFSAIYTVELAKLVEKIWHGKLSGLFHCASSTALSKYAFAVQLAKVFGYEESLIEPISVESLNLPAKRAKNLSLSTKKLEGVLGETLPTLLDSIEKFHQDYQKELPRQMRCAHV